MPILEVTVALRAGEVLPEGAARVLSDRSRGARPTGREDRGTR